VRHSARWRRTSARASAWANDDRTYYAIDAQGVALAAIQALESPGRPSSRSASSASRRENRQLAKRLRRR
jgi:hypothetical protein